MADVFPKEKRSWVMSRIRGRNTKPEFIVRSALHGAGFRFRIHVSSLPGRPDIVLRKHGAVIFVHGCFWHQHPGCRRAVLPKSNVEYWLPKLERNTKRFQEVRRTLRRLGWKVIVIWECMAKDPGRLLKYIASRLGGKSGPA